MARPTKEGLDYFPLDTDIDQDDKIALIEADFGIEGFGIVIKLLMKIYSNGYFYEWGEVEQKLFGRRINVDINLLTDVVNACINWGLFDRTVLREYQVLTSAGIQKRYFEATKRRKEVEAFEEYLLLKKSELKTFFNVNIISVNDDINEADDNSNDTKGVTETDDISAETPQSKVKESKGKKSIAAGEEKNSGGDPQLTKNVFVAWEELWMFPNLVQKEILIELQDKYSDQLVVAAIKIAGSKDVIKGRAINFIEAVLKEWEDNNVTTIEKAREYQRNRNKNNQSHNKQAKEQESLPDWAKDENKYTSENDEVVDDGFVSERLERLQKLREGND